MKQYLMPVTFLHHCLVVFVRCSCTCFRLGLRRAMPEGCGCKVIPRSGWAQPDPRYSFDALRASRRAAQISKLVAICRLERSVLIGLASQ